MSGSSSQCAAFTAMSLSTDDAGVYDLGRCRLCTVQHTDCGLTWSAYPSAQPTPSKKARKRKQKGTTTPVPAAGPDNESTTEALALQELGLPTAFGTSKGEAYAEDDSCAAIDHATQAAGMHVGASNDLKWQQDFDFTTGFYYYYRVGTQETQWQPPLEGYLPVSEYWLAVEQAEWPATQDVTDHESAEDMMTEESGAPATTDHAVVSTNAAGDSLSRLVLDDADTPSTPKASADAPAQPELNPAGACDSAHPAATEPAATNAAEPSPVAHSAAASHSSRQGSSAAASASDSASASASAAASAAAAAASTSAVIGNNLGAAMPAARVESTGVMATIPAPQGHHIRYDSTDADSDSDGMPLHSSPVSLQGPSAEPSQSSDCMLNSVDQQAVVHAVADCNAPGCTSASSASNSLVSDGIDVSAAMLEDAMQGVSATTVVPPAVSDLATQASDILAELADAPTQISALHSDSSADLKLREACSSEANHAQSSVGSAATPAHMAGIVDPKAGNQAQQDHCSSQEVAAESQVEVEAAAIMYGSLINQVQSKSELPRKLWKYWLQRFSLFSRFQDGILMDEEGWYSATPEVVAAHHASRCRCSVVVDAFAGVGGNAIQFAMTCDRVIAVELCPHRLEIARHNAQVYGVAHKIDFVCGDFLKVAATLKADVVFLSPPWGGPAYSQSGTFDVRQEIDSLGQNLSELVQTASCALREPASKAVACFLPRNSDLQALGETLQSGDQCLVERNVLNLHLKAVTIYYGSLASS